MTIPAKPAAWATATPDVADVALVAHTAKGEEASRVALVADVADAAWGGEAHPLDLVRGFLTRFVAFPSPHAEVACALWVAHTHVLDAFDTTPRLALLSPEPGSGKTRALEVLELLVPNPMPTFNASAAVLFRSMTLEDEDTGELLRPTVLLDEADTVWGPRASKDHEDLRGFVNAGYRRGAAAQRAAMRGKTVIIETFPAFAGVAIAGLDDLPDTVMTRSIVIRMRRRSHTERVEPYRRRLHAISGHTIRDLVRDWITPHTEDLADAWPDMPPGVEDRAADCWEPLLAIADTAGGPWPDLAREAAAELVAAGRGRGETLGIRLLTDIRAVFDRHGADRMPTAELLERLVAMEESPWGDLRGKPLDARGLSRRLARYQVGPKDIRTDTGHVLKGYLREDLVDPWDRYLPAPHATSATSATSATGHPSPPHSASATSATSATKENTR